VVWSITGTTAIKLSKFTMGIYSPLYILIDDVTHEK